MSQAHVFVGATGQEVPEATLADVMSQADSAIFGYRATCGRRGDGQSAEQLRPVELVERTGADILAKVDRRWPRRRHELGPCLVWAETQRTDSAGRTNGRMYAGAIGKTEVFHGDRIATDLEPWPHSRGVMVRPVPRGPLHSAVTDGHCTECGETFPCPTGRAIFTSAVKPNRVPHQVHLVLHPGELASIVMALRADGQVELAERLAATLRQI